jgi:hypothetical protein
MWTLMRVSSIITQSWYEFIDPYGMKGLVDLGRMESGIEPSTSRLRKQHYITTVSRPLVYQEI